MQKQRIKDIATTFLITSILFTTSLSVSAYISDIKATATNEVTIYIDDEEMLLERMPIVFDDYVYVPVRNVARELDKGIYYDKTTKTISMIDTPSTLDDDTMEFLLGTWKVDNLAGFALHTNDDAQEPNGPDFIGSEIIISQNHFSSMDLKGNPRFQFDYNNPKYSISGAYPDSFEYYKENKAELEILENATDIKNIQIYKADKSDYATFSLVTVDNEKLLLALGDGAYFELVKVD